jgi:hypothetical protein
LRRKDLVVDIGLSWRMLGYRLCTAHSISPHFAKPTIYNATHLFVDTEGITDQRGLSGSRLNALCQIRVRYDGRGTLPTTRIRNLPEAGQ